MLLYWLVKSHLVLTNNKYTVWHKSTVHFVYSRETNPLGWLKNITLCFIEVFITMGEHLWLTPEYTLCRRPGFCVVLFIEPLLLCAVWSTKFNRGNKGCHSNTANQLCYSTNTNPQDDLKIAFMLSLNYLLFLANISQKYITSYCRFNKTILQLIHWLYTKKAKQN